MYLQICIDHTSKSRYLLWRRSYNPLTLRLLLKNNGDVGDMVLPRIFDYTLDERIQLIDTIRGKRPASIIISNVNIVLTPTGEILENGAIIVAGRRIAGIGEYENLHRFIGRDTIVIDGKDWYAMPGFIDGHIHIESSLLTPRGFAKLALRHGTTTVVVDPHEIANVLGLDGVKIFLEEAKGLPLKILIDIPSCVPATDPEFGLETTNKVLTAKDIEELAKMEGTSGLGEVMDFVSVVNASKYVLEKIRVAYKYGLVVNGHAPLLRGELLDAYLDASIWSDHESVLYEEALEKLRKGMFVFIRQGSAWKDLKALIDLPKKLDCKLCGFVSDDLNVADLYEKGHMDRVINEAIELGLDPIKAIQLATIGPALRLHLEDHIGILGPARLADIVLSPTLKQIRPETVISNGEIIYYKCELQKTIPRSTIPDFAKKTVNIKKIPEPEELMLRLDKEKGIVKVNVIKVEPGSAITKWITEELVVQDYYVRADPDRDIIYAVVIDRHKATGNIGKGFIKGLGFKGGALAQTIAHDTHNLIVAGTSPEDMSLAIKRIVELQGGIAIVDKGKVVAELPLPVAGLMSDKEPEEVYREYKELVRTAKENFGVEFEAFFMTLALAALPVIPELRLTDRGLVDVNNAKLIPVIVKEK